MPLENLLEKMKANEVILWTGAGFSLYAGMPSVKEIKEELLTLCNREERSNLKQIINLPEVFEEFIRLRNGSREEITEVLKKLIDKEPASILYHKLLSEIPQIDTIITTNYDRLFEIAYRDEIGAITDDSNLDDSAGKRVKLYKIHGDVRNPESMLVSSRDYRKNYHRNKQRLWKNIKKLVAEKSIVFVGYSFADENNDFLISNVLKYLEKKQKTSYLVSPEISELKITHLEKKNIELINNSGEEFIRYLHSQLSAENEMVRKTGAGK
ncbi:SIR2 family NAD-dependent protein deacylase [Sediminibacillus albus]|uniref:SIR2-like domain-containing protein n=1 Tax=Sediminibacillus albus TaxID=407036 RepID=A0A1G8X491_9BACI|nr:SIR2 family protein [Sediminibacillus albus]SDJ85167.1 SIR2-like domain-containing protein [Sediminibacillus albus]